MNSEQPVRNIKRKLGRKSEWEVTAEVIKTVEALSGRGLTIYQIQDYFGISPSTWQRRSVDVEELRLAFRRGKAKQIAHVSGKLIEQINGGSVPATIFYLKTQACWKEDKDSETKEQESQAVTINVNDPIDAVKVYQQFIRGTSHE